MRIINVFAALALFASGLAHAGGTAYFDVTVTNITPGQTFTPLIVATHKNSIAFFEAGAPASSEIAAIAEGGDAGPLAGLLASVPDLVFDIGSSGGLLGPGQSVTVRVAAKGNFNRISLAGMLLPTNDTVVAVDSASLPRSNRATVVKAVAYDAGSEPNDESCDHIPGGADCGGEGISPGVDGEGYVHVSRGIHGIGDLDAAAYDWRNPVAKVTIQRAD